MMKDSFRCGRLVINKDGSVKKLDLADGGGTRNCPLSHIDIGFEEIHDNLREIFSLDQTERNSKLYDFQRKELDTKRYSTFFEYINRNGLKFNGTLLYLCTPADNENIINSTSPEKRRTIIQSIQTPNSNEFIYRIPQVEADSSTSPIIIKTDDPPPIIPKPTNQSIINNSFEKLLNEFIDYLRNLIIKYNHEIIFIQLFEYICTIRGLSLIIFDQLKKQNQLINQYEKYIYNNNLDKIEKLFQSIKILIELNKMKISHINQYEIIINLFKQFHQNFYILRNQLINNKNTHKQSTSYSSTSQKRKSTEEEYSLFKNILKSFDHLLDILHQLHLTSFYYFIKTIINEIELCRSNIKLSEYRSLYNAEKLIISIENRLTNRINDEYHHAAPHGLNRQLEYSFDKILDSIRQLLNSFRHYQSKINKHKRSRNKHYSSHIDIDKKPIINLNQQQTRINDDDQSSEASHSSFGDEILMEVARDAYEQRPNCYK